MYRGWAKVSACRMSCAARSCRSGICPGLLSTAWLVSLVVFSCHNMTRKYDKGDHILYGLQVVTREVHRSSLVWFMCLAQDHFIVLTLLIIYDICPLPVTDGGLSNLVCDVEHTYFHFGQCSRKLVMCLASASYPQPAILRCIYLSSLFCFML